MKRHTFDPLSFVAGAILLFIAGASMLNTDLDYQLSDWVIPASVLVLGVGLLVASLRGISSGHRPQTTDHRPEADAADDDGRWKTDDGADAEGDGEAADMASDDLRL